jgi:hypothetical protein
VALDGRSGVADGLLVVVNGPLYTVDNSAYANIMSRNHVSQENTRLTFFDLEFSSAAEKWFREKV